MSFNYAFKKIIEKKIYSKTMRLCFRNIRNKKIYVDIEIFLDNKRIYEKWFNSLIDIIKNDNIIYSKNFSIVGNFSKNRTPDLIIKQLLRSIEILKKSSWYQDYNLINEDYTNLIYTFDRELLNKLHHHFEILHGQVWDPSVFLEKSTGEERFAISHLNLCCHELEAYYDSKIKKEKKEDLGVYFYFSVCGVSNFKEITKEDKLSFSKKVKNGMVYLHYAQTGKTWHEAYIDNDDLVETNNISEHRRISGEFCSYIGPDFEFSTDIKFKEYIQQRGFDWDDPNLAIGYCPVGQILSVNNVNIDDYEKCQKILAEYDDFYGIEIDNGLKRYYDYKSDSEEYYKLMCQVFSTWSKS